MNSSPSPNAIAAIPSQPDFSSDFWDSYIPERQASEFLSLTTRCLQGWRYRGGGPPYHRIGGRVRYTRRALAQWANQRQRASTSDPGAPET